MSKKEVQKNGFNGLKILCVLSVIGFIASMYIDAGNYYLYSNIEQYLDVQDQELAGNIEEKLSIFSEANVDVSEKGIDLLAWMFFGRGVLDVLALLGVMLMFYKLKIGFNLYVLFQLLYVVLPFMLIGKGVNVVVPYELMMINLVYIALYVTQRKHLI